MARNEGKGESTIRAIQSGLTDKQQIIQYVKSDIGKTTTESSVGYWKTRVKEWFGHKPSSLLQGWRLGVDRADKINQMKYLHPGKKHSAYDSYVTHFNMVAGVFGGASSAGNKAKAPAKRQPKQPNHDERLKWNKQVKAGIKQDLFDLQFGVCVGCGQQHNDPSAMQIDHNLSDKTKGGTNHFHNLQLLCQSCNAAKGDLTLLEWKGLDHVRQVADWLFNARINKEGWIERSKFDKVSGDLRLAQAEIHEMKYEAP